MATVATDRPRRAWDLREQRPEVAERLEREAGLGPVAARVMAARGWDDPAEVKSFLTGGLSTLHDPAGLPDMGVATERIARAIGNGETICVHGDYDVDGTTGSAVLLKTLARLGAPGVVHDTPHRVNDGYGIKPEAVERLAERGVSLIITVDNGTTAHAALERAKSLGVDVIVTDHHQVDEELPPAVAIINPWRGDAEYPCRDLCGCALAFKLAQALLKSMGRSAEESLPFLKSLLDLVAVATVADIVPMRGENRAIVRYGLSRLADTECLGLRALLREARIREVSADKIGWVIGPRINAAGRTSHASTAVELLTTEDPERAGALARELEARNTERRAIEAALLEEALEELEGHADEPVIVLARPGWHFGVLGIVASRIMDRTCRPTLLLTVEGDHSRGSGRSFDGFDLHGALTACREHLEGFGGHTKAAGLSCRTDQIDAFRAAISAHARSLGPEAMRPRPHAVDTELHAEELVAETLAEIDALEPFGEGHPRPLFVLRDVSPVDTPQVLKGKHLKWRMALPTGRSLTALAWNRADQLSEFLPSPRSIDLLGRPTLNEWNGRRSVEFIVTDWRITEA